MTTTTNAKRGRRRQQTYPRRLELRMTSEQFELASTAAIEASERLGRSVTVSDVVRASIEDGCAGLAVAMSRPTTSDGASDDALAILGERIQAMREELRRIGVNANQLAKVANVSGQVPSDLDTIAAALSSMNAELVSAAARAYGVSES